FTEGAAAGARGTARGAGGGLPGDPAGRGRPHLTGQRGRLRGAQEAGSGKRAKAGPGARGHHPQA
ncbi:hypothetical protein E2I00_003786, partial [Balaenoptera physalus]